MNTLPPDDEPALNEIAPLAAWLEVDRGGLVKVNGTCSIGRAASNQLPLDSEKVSRRHAIIHAQENGQFWLVDLGSVNGTSLNGRRVTQPVRLRDSDQIEISQFRIRFRQPDRDASQVESRTDASQTIHEMKTVRCWLLLADIAGSTELLRNGSPEQLAAMTGRWLAECKQLVEECGGAINKFLGDGFFAYWHERERISVNVARALEALKRLQQNNQPQFRIIIHHGLVCAGGGPSMGEESLSGPEVNFIFRMEKLAGSQSQSRFASEAAASQLMALFPVNILGAHSLPGFEGEFTFYTF
jgi:class 3 adenylate cyclase